MPRLTSRIAILCLLPGLLVAQGCRHRLSVYYPNYAALDGAPEVLPRENVETARTDIETKQIHPLLLRAQRIVRFWEDAQQEYGTFLAAADPEASSRQIARLVDRYAAWPHKQAVRRELLEAPWPYGLRNRPGTAPESDLTALPQTAPGPELSPRLSPDWVDQATAPRAENPDPDWADGVRLSDLRTFWLSVALTVSRQKEFIDTQRRLGADQATSPSPDERPDDPLPMDEDQRESLTQIQRFFGPFPAFQQDHRLFQPLDGPGETWEPPRSELYGRSSWWTTVLLTGATGLHWMVDADYAPDELSKNLRIYRQGGYGYMLLPGLGVARHETHVYGEDDGFRRHRIGSSLVLWPFYLGARGRVLTLDGRNHSIDGFGIPILFSLIRSVDDEGQRRRYVQGLHALAYYGSTYETLTGRRDMHLLGLGALWMSHRNSWRASATHGPLWGAFGWGQRDGHPTLQLLWFPIPLGREE